jgi:hypothetical protein
VPDHFPASQGMHVATETASAVPEYLPATHEVHTDESLAAHVPATHPCPVTVVSVVPVTVAAAAVYPVQPPLVMVAAVKVSDPRMVYVAVVNCACVCPILMMSINKPRRAPDPKQAFMEPQIQFHSAGFQPK